MLLTLPEHTYHISYGKPEPITEEETAYCSCLLLLLAMITALPKIPSLSKIDKGLANETPYI